MKVVITNQNQIGKVNLSKVASTVSGLGDLIDVDTSGRQDGYVLTYNAATNTYIFTQVQNTAVTTIDGGFY